MDTQPGAVRDRLVRFLGGVARTARCGDPSAQAEGSLDPAEDPADLTFEIEAALFLANAQFVVLHTSEPIERARRAITRRLAAVATSGEASTRG